MPEICLQRSGVMSVIRELVAAGVAQHVWMGLKSELGLGAGPFNHPGESGRTKRRAALGGEHERRFRLLLTQSILMIP